MGGKNKRLGLTTKQVSVIRSEFASQDVARVKRELERVTPADTMDSAHNWANTIAAILELSKGDISILIELVEAARRDFRDLIYWAMLERAQ